MRGRRYGETGGGGGREPATAVIKEQVEADAGNQRRPSKGNSSGGRRCPENEAAGKTSEAEVLVARTTGKQGQVIFSEYGAYNLGNAGSGVQVLQIPSSIWAVFQFAIPRSCKQLH